MKLYVVHQWVKGKWIRLKSPAHWLDWNAKETITEQKLAASKHLKIKVEADPATIPKPKPHPKPSPGQVIVDHARVDLGRHEDPPGSNSGQFVRLILAEAHCPDHNPWCAAWATHIVNLSAKKDRDVLPVLATAGCGQLRSWAQYHRRYTTHPEPGCIGIFKHDEHAVIVTAVNAGGTVRAIAGNTSQTNGTNPNGGCVAEHDHMPLSLFEGFVLTTRR